MFCCAGVFPSRLFRGRACHRSRFALAARPAVEADSNTSWPFRCRVHSRQARAVGRTGCDRGRRQGRQRGAAAPVGIRPTAVGSWLAGQLQAGGGGRGGLGARSVPPPTCYCRPSCCLAAATAPRSKVPPWPLTPAGPDIESSPTASNGRRLRCGSATGFGPSEPTPRICCGGRETGRSRHLSWSGITSPSRAGRRLAAASPV